MLILKATFRRSEHSAAPGRKPATRAIGGRARLMMACLLANLLTLPARAHEGPPFPLFMDKPCGELSVSLWADPDIGDAQFFIVVETPEGTVPDAEPQVAIWTQPTSGRLDRKLYPAKRQSLRNRMQFEAKPYFDQRDLWNIGVDLTGADGQRRELLAEVESTPPGLGPWDLAIYLFPFLLMGGLWIAAMVRRRRSLRRQPPAERESQDALTTLPRAARPSEASSAADGAR